MKPTKNRVYCKDCGRFKMLFETEKKADTFMKFNSEEIIAISGHCPKRSYFCIYCNGWHVTSTDPAQTIIKSKTEIMLDLYHDYKDKKAIEKHLHEETRKTEIEALRKRLDEIRDQIYGLEATVRYGKVIENIMSIIDELTDEMNEAKRLKAHVKGIKSIETRLLNLRNALKDETKK